MFSNPRYSTRGISETVPILTQIILWNCIDSMKTEKDYLQVFKLTAKDHTQHVTHSQEEPAYEHTFDFRTDEPITAKIFVIDDETHSTMLLAEDIEEEHTMDNNETTRPVCSCCGATIETDDYYTFDGNILCDDCYHSETVTCEHCGDRIWADDNAGTDSMPLCNSCYDDYYTTCECCGRIIHRDYANYDDDDDYAYCDRCYEERQNSSIHEYNYKPDPIFYGDSKRYFGVELEIDEGAKNGDNADTILGIGNRIAEHIYIKSDGSLSDGMEIVTHPMLLRYHKDKMPWSEIMRSAIRMDYRSHKTSTCGLHIHVNRTAFGATREAQDECVSRVLYFVEHHWLELLKFSRRTEYQMNRWAARYGYKNTPKEILEDAKKGCNGRYACVNITNYHTIEFRMFRGTLKYNTLIATLELVDKICELATDLTDTELKSVSWSDFVGSLDDSTEPELITYLKERQLYINTPITTEEDD